MAAVTAGALTALYSILASLCRVAGGSISDRLGGAPTLLLSLVVTGIGAMLMTLSRASGQSIAGEIVMAIGMGVSNAAVFKLVPQVVPQAVGGASGWVGGLGAFGGFLIPPLLGAIAASQGPAGYPAGFGLFIGLTVFSLVLVLVLRRKPREARGSRPALEA